MGDEQDAHPCALTNATEQCEDLCLDSDIECGRGLVGDEQIGIVRQCERNRDTLFLSAGELMGKVVDPLGGSGISTCSRSEIASALASAFETFLCARMASRSCQPMRRTGFNALCGSWKINATSEPR